MNYPDEKLSLWGGLSNFIVYNRSPLSHGDQPRLLQQPFLQQKVVSPDGAEAAELIKFAFSNLTPDEPDAVGEAGYSARVPVQSGYEQVFWIRMTGLHMHLDAASVNALWRSDICPSHG